MAATAAKKRKKLKSYASAVRGVEEKNDFFTLAKCNLKQPEHMPNGRIPNTTEAHSFFVDLKSTNATNAEVLNAINTAGIIGANVRDDLWVIEFVCKDDASVEKAMNTAFAVEGKQPFVAIYPRHKTNKTILIKIANMPFGQEDELRQALVQHWSTLGKVIDAQPYMFPGRPWLTKRWDLLLQLPDGMKDLKAPPVFNLFGYPETIISSWNGSKKACLHCKSAGHSSSSCPVKFPKNQKVGALTNPHQKISGVGQDKNSSAEVAHASTSGSAHVTPPATLATPATVEPTPASLATSATVATPVPSVTFTAESPVPRQKYTYSFGPRPNAAGVFARTTTPPPQPRPDPDTLRKERKRMAKDDDPWTPSPSDLRAYTTDKNICLRCCEAGHQTDRCTNKTIRSIPITSLASSERFRPHMETWANARRKRGQSWRFYDSRVSGPYEPPTCTRCGLLGHINSECTATLKCNHCSQDHLGINCPNRERYAFEDMEE